jgi:hypothetical protein
MQFVILIYQGTTPLPGSDAWEALDPADQKQIYADYAALSTIEGLTPGLPLGLPDDAATVTVADGAPVTTPGPFVGGTGWVGGFSTYEGESLEDAVAVAARIPAARLGGAVEVRPVATYW